MNKDQSKKLAQYEFYDSRFKSLNMQQSPTVHYFSREPELSSL